MPMNDANYAQLKQNEYFPYKIQFKSILNDK